MSTSAEIYFEGSETVIYKHWDGYPEGPAGVVSWLAPFVAEFHTRRGYDPEYLPARLLMYLGAREAKEHERLVARAVELNDEYHLDRLAGQIPGIGDACSYGLMCTVGAGAFVYYVDLRGGIHVLDGHGKRGKRGVPRWASPLPEKPERRESERDPEDEPQDHAQDRG